MNSSQRVQGALICVAAAVSGLLFLGGVMARSYWALAIPLTALVLFLLGMVFWVGWTILTVRIDAAADHPEATDGDANPLDAERRDA